MPDSALPEPDRRKWLIIDVLLIIVALAMGCWTFAAVTWRGHPDAGRTILVPAEAAGAQLTLFIDATNQIHVAETRLEGTADLIDALSNPPEQVLLLVHPDGLLEHVVQTIRLLRRAGVQVVQLGTSDSFVGQSGKGVEA
jgi:biopolymer transport protein ExbD